MNDINITLFSSYSRGIHISQTRYELIGWDDHLISSSSKSLKHVGKVSQGPTKTHESMFKNPIDLITRNNGHALTMSSMVTT